MRFSATFQHNYLRVVGTVYVFVLPSLYFVNPNARKDPLHSQIIAWAVWAMMLVAVLPQYYEIREDHLFLRLGLKTRLIPYASLLEIEDWPDRTNRLGAELNLVRLTTDTGEIYTFGVQEKDRFLRELWNRCRKWYGPAIDFQISCSPSYGLVSLSVMSRILTAAIFAGMLCMAGRAQTPDGRKLEFEAASVKSVPAPTGFRSFSPDTGTGGPGTPDPGMFRCGTCTLATLISRAFHLQDYQFPGRGSLPGGNFEVAARIPPSASEEEFEAMLQSLLKDRFGLTYHFDEKTMPGYHLVLAKGGARLKESTGSEPAKANGWGHGDGGHSHTGVLNFGGQARYQASDRTIGDLARVLSDQLGRPVDDQTGLRGKYDIALSWSAESAGGSQHEHDAGGAEHAGHGGAPASSGDASGPGLGQALESQLGLKLVAGTKSVVRIFVVDHVEKVPASN